MKITELEQLIDIRRVYLILQVVIIYMQMTIDPTCWSFSPDQPSGFQDQ